MSTMQVADIDPGMSVSIQTLEQSGCCKRKRASKEQTQYSKTCEITTRVLSSWVTREAHTACVFVIGFGVTNSVVFFQRGALSSIRDKSALVVFNY